MIHQSIGYFIVVSFLIGCCRLAYMFYKPKEPDDRAPIGCLFFMFLFGAGFFAWLFGI